jgi:ABC-type branched-subunit amino acid transport system substrate-binding protein
MKVLLKCLGAVCFCFVFLTSGSVRAGGPGKEVKVGVLTSISGPFGEEGGEHGCIGCSQAIANGAQLAAYELNRGGGILNHWVRPIIKDTRGTDQGARKAVAELAAEDVVAIVGVHQSEAVLGAADMAAGKGVLLLVTTAAHPALAARIAKDYPGYRTVFRIGKELAQWGDMTKLFLEQVAEAKNYYFMGYDAIWNHKLADHLMQHCSVPCLGASFYPPGSGPSEKQMQEIRDRSPDIVVNGDPGGTRYVVLHHQFKVPGTIFSVGGALANANTIRSLDGAGNLLVFHSAYYDTSGAFYKNFVDYHGFEPLWYCDVLAYEAVQLIAEACARTESFARDRLIEALEKGTFTGLAGRYRFDGRHQARWGEDSLPGYICQWHGTTATVLYPIARGAFVRK